MKKIRAENFSQNLRLLRLKLGHTQESLAEAIESTHATINRWENGVSKPNYLDFYKIMKCLGVSFEVLSGLEVISSEMISREPTLSEALELLTKETGIILKLPKGPSKQTEESELSIKISKLTEKELDLINRTVDKMLNSPEKKKKAN